ncbi:hypothetical protein FNF27_07865 [Cafeteria roenbergensis]|uniref:Uncharacterized protein n=1 Tax=Cafeteria roenbergensis TaxID=33653 RepID=A0A5A8CMC6_CAFRO|nr:hypothetical protein FNF29_02503 [Cafeteria roenbergensis]KAA0159068.1 hypothetical protein FNF31_05020 [Cafeteria roenbergensis]KAA0163907.1 hypothetical protein FNF27_07865 [Cafeteria roenbergensis]|eukprot:KAA0154283.1 hypothetical protein FNF29_02503 [Cafeteria roenbergensis]
MASVPGIVSSALGQLPAREDWLSQATLSSPGAVVPKLTSLLSTKDATLVLLQYSLMRNAELTRVGGKLIDPSESVLANVQRYFVEVSPSVVKQYCVRVAQILAAQAVAEKNPSFGTMVCANSSTESARLWQETLAAGGGSFSDRLDVAGRVFVISLASGSVQYAAMWAVNVSLVAGRRAYGSLRRRFLLQALTDAASRVDKAKAAAKLAKHDEETPPWSSVATEATVGGRRMAVTVLVASAGAALGSVVYPGTGAYILGLVGSIVGMAIV